MGKLDKNKSAITQIEVEFKEIDRLFDTLPDSQSGPIPRYQMAAVDRFGNAQLIVKDYFSRGPDDVSYSDENGEPLKEKMPRLLGWYRTLRSGAPPHFIWRTFARKNSRPISNKYVYVWAADTKDGSALHLKHELYFSGGRFQHIDVKSKDRKPKGTSLPKLVLDLHSFDNMVEKQQFYFFMLARFQIPSARLQGLATSEVLTRSVHLWDECHFDRIAPDGTVMELDRKAFTLETHGLLPKVSYRIHLLDPLREALKRSERYKNALRRYQEAQEELNKDNLYLLAKRIQVLCKNEQELTKYLAPSFGQYLQEHEQSVRRQYFVMWLLVTELIRWIGQTEKREKFAFKSGKSDSWLFIPGDKVGYSQEDKGADIDHNFYSQACRDYLDEDAKDVCSDIADIMGLVMDGIDQSPAGAEWLERLFKKSDEGEIPELESAAAEYFFEAKRKGNEFVKAVSVKLLEKLGPVWVRHYREDALKNLADWFKKKYGTTVREVEAGFNRAQRRAFESGLRREFKHVRKAGVTKLEFVPGGLDGLGLAAKQLQVVQSAIEIVNLCHAISELGESKGDAFKILECMGSALDFYSAMKEVGKDLEYISAEVMEHGSLASKFMKVPVASAVIDVITGAHDIYEAQTVGSQMANGMRTIGAALVIGGEVAEAHPAGWVAAAAGVLLESGGSYLRDQTRPVCTFLRNCYWGVGPNTMDSGGAMISDESAVWYKGKLSDLKPNIPVQHRCLDELINNHDAVVEFEGKGSECHVKCKIASNPGALSPEAEWDVKIELTTWAENDSGAGAKQTITFAPTDDFDHINLTAGMWYTTKIFDQSPMAGPDTRWLMRYSANVKTRVDLLGDGAHVMEREASANFTFRPEIQEMPAGGVPGEPQDAGVSNTDAGAPSGGQ